MNSKYKLVLPLNKDHDEMPFNWLCYNKSENNLKGTFTFDNDDNGSNIFFSEKEDMELFILMWGEYL